MHPRSLHAFRFGAALAIALLRVLLIVGQAGAAFPGRDGMLAIEQSDYSDSGVQFDNPPQSDAALRAFPLGGHSHSLLSCTGAGNSDSECDAGRGCPDPSSTNTPCLDLGRPAFSADGRTIAFANDVCPNTFCRRLALVGADGSGETMLPPLTADDAQPAFMPSGGLVFSGRATRAAIQNLYTVGIDGTGLRRLTSAGGAEPAPCADGALVYVFHRDLWLMSRNQRTRRRLTFRGGGRPDCSPDGRTIAFVNHGDVYLIGRTGRGLRRLTTGSGVDGAPAFSPDGRRIAFTAQHRASKAWPPSGGGSRENSYLQVVDQRGHAVRRPILLGTSGADQDGFGYGTSAGGVGWQPLRAAFPQVAPAALVRSAARPVALGPRVAVTAAAWTLAGKLNLPGSQEISPIACPTRHQCTAADPAGAIVTFDPTRSGVSPGVPLPGTGPIAALACVSPTQCTAVREPLANVTQDTAVTFDPLTGMQIGPAIPLGTQPGIDSLTFAFGALSCPAASQCTAADENGTETVTFDPLTGATSVQRVSPLLVLRALACASNTTCVAIDAGAHAHVFDPRGSGAVSSFYLAGGAVDGDAVACPTRTECVALSDGGVPGHTRTTAFDPAAPGHRVVVRLPFRSYGSGLACPSKAHCTAASAAGETVTFNPLTGARAGHRKLRRAGGAIACPVTTQCTLSGAGASTFDPGGSGPVHVRREPLARLVSVACPPGGRCTAITRGGVAVTFRPRAPGAGVSFNVDPGGGAAAVACPSARQCTVVDARGRELTFDPHSPRRPRPVRVQRYGALIAVTCPTARLCTTITQDGGVVSFVPRTGTRLAQGRLGPQSPLSGLDCPTAHECIAVGSGPPPGAAYEVGFDPLAPRSRNGPVVESSGTGATPTGVACRSANACVLTDAAGGEVAFNPISRTHGPRNVIDPGTKLAAIACNGAVSCAAVDSQGRVLTGDPAAGTPWMVDPIPGASPLTAVACSAAAGCVAVDDHGDAASGPG